jgi:hypothetical protein
MGILLIYTFLIRCKLFLEEISLGNHGLPKIFQIFVFIL